MAGLPPPECRCCGSGHAWGRVNGCCESDCRWGVQSPGPQDIIEWGRVGKVGKSEIIKRQRDAEKDSFVVTC